MFYFCIKNITECQTDVFWTSMNTQKFPLASLASFIVCAFSLVKSEENKRVILLVGKVAGNNMEWDPHIKKTHNKTE